MAPGSPSRRTRTGWASPVTAAVVDGVGVGDAEGVTGPMTCGNGAPGAGEGVDSPGPSPGIVGTPGWPVGETDGAGVGDRWCFGVRDRVGVGRGGGVGEAECVRLGLGDGDGARHHLDRAAVGEHHQQPCRRSCRTRRRGTGE